MAVEEEEAADILHHNHHAEGVDGHSFEVVCKQCQCFAAGKQAPRILRRVVVWLGALVRRSISSTIISLSWVSRHDFVAGKGVLLLLLLLLL